MEKSISESEEKVHGKELICFAFSIMASLFAFFHSRRGSNWHAWGIKEKIESMGL
jgi:hypothetical protein